MKQLVSILIPTFNAEQWIRDCIESALAQTWLWKEIIIVDDGSRDRTLDIAQLYSAANIKVVSQVNKGASAARNYALSLAQGDYIQWLDADDLLAPDKITLQLRDAESGNISRVLLSGAWGKFYHVPEKSKYVSDSLWEDLEPVEWLFRKMDKNLWMAIETWLVSRRLTEMAGPWDETLYRDNDGEYFSRLILSSQRVRFIKDARCICRRSNLGISNNLTLNSKKLDSMATVICLHVERLMSMENTLRTRSACLKYLNRWAIYFYPERPDILQQMQLLAQNLGGTIDKPKLRTKYRWLRYILGWRIAKKAQNTIPILKSRAESYIERL